MKHGTTTGLFIKNGGSYKAAKKKKKARRGVKKSGGGGTGGLQAEKDLSEELAAIVGTDRLSRAQVVKELWVYIKDRDLQVSFFSYPSYDRILD